MSDPSTPPTMADESPQDSGVHTDVDAAEVVNSQQASTATATGKRKAESELAREGSFAPSDRQNAETGDKEGANDGDEVEPDKPLSKNQLKRLRRRQQFEVYREGRKVKRKEKRHAKQERKREERNAKIAEAEAAGLDPETVLRPQGEPWRPRPVPVAFIIDCDFEAYMRENEIVSLSSQITRSYSKTRKGKYQPHLFISSWKGKLKSRFETVLENTHHHWKGVGIVEGDFCDAAKEAKALMEGGKAGGVIDLIAQREDDPAMTSADDLGPVSPAEDIDQSVVYLSSESPYTLKRLEPNTSYVIGGLVDRNREKGLCYKRAKDYKVRTAKLPIGEYMAMQDRYVLTTNQVIEIMVKWLECGDWGEAFLDIIPKRKGGTLKKQGSQADPDEFEGGTVVEDLEDSKEAAA
jgi:tRNA (guanine9-N1)-methyltransferase